jgi:hypothetical protein
MKKVTRDIPSGVTGLQSDLFFKPLDGAHLPTTNAPRPAHNWRDILMSKFNTEHRRLWIKVVLTMTTTAIIGSTLSAKAFSLRDLDPAKIVRSITSANVNVHNHYPFAIRVVMDSNREAHVIAPGGMATFTKANKGDRPTFRAYKDDAVIDSQQVFLDGNKTVNFR